MTESTTVSSGTLSLNKVDDAAGDSLVTFTDTPLQSIASDASSVVDKDLATRTKSEVEELELGTHKRDQWSNQYEFLFSLISMSVGLGNVWRFPVVASQNGGGAFLLPYMILLIFVGRPIYFLELAIGQFSSKTQVNVWDCCPILKGIGISAMLSTICVLTYYTSILSLIILYFVESFFPTLPWTICPQTTNCSNVSTAQLHLLKDVLHQRANINNGIGFPDWKLTLCLLVAWLIICFSLIKGVKSSGKVAYFTAIFPYAVLITLLIRGAMLKGAKTGILKFVKPDFMKLLEPKVWYMAASQAFFSLNTVFGSVIMFASYNPFRHNIYRDAIILSATDTVTSLIAGITVFSVAGYLAEVTGKDVEEILSAGESGIAFITYPTVVSELPWPNFFAAMFFLMLFALGLGSSAADAGAIIAIIADKYPKVERWKITCGICLAAFSVGILYVTEGGQFVLTLVDAYGASFCIFLVAVLEITAIAYIYKLRNFISDIEFMLNRKLGWYWKICWYGIIPFGLSCVLIYSLIFDLFAQPLKYNGVMYPVSAYVFGWLLALTCLSPVVICAAQELVAAKATTFLEKVKEASKPKRTWGPLDPIIRAKWKEYKKENGRT